MTAVHVLEPLGALKAEIIATATLDIGYARGVWKSNATFFGSNLANATEIVAVG